LKKIQLYDIINRLNINIFTSIKKFSKSKIVVPVILLFIILFAFFRWDKEVEPEPAKKVYLPQVELLEVRPGLLQEFTVTGEIFAHQFSRITAELRAVVNSIIVKIGDKVERDQVLITLNSSQVTSTFGTASSSLKNARNSMNSTSISAQKSIEAAQVAYETAQTNLKNTLNQNRKLKDQAKEALEASKLSVGLSVTSAETNLRNTIKNSLPTVNSSITAADKILGISETYKYTNDAFETNIGALNRGKKDETIRALQDIMNRADSNISTYDDMREILSDTQAMLTKVSVVLNFSVPGSTYSESALTLDITSITAQITAVRTAISTLDSAKDVVESAAQDSGGESQTVLTAKATYDATIAQLEASQESARKAVESAEIALENVKQSANLSNIGARSSVDAAFGTYDQARISKDKLTIQAPFNAKVVDIPVKVGEEVNPGTLLITVEDDSELDLVAYLSLHDVDRVNVGDEVIIDKLYKSTIASISPSADPVTKKFKVELDYDHSDFRAGEIVSLTFETGNGPESDRLFIPLPALHILPGEMFVWKVENRKTIKAPVETGEIVGDYVEIVSGLSEGDKIVSNGGGRLIEDEGVQVDILNESKPNIPTS